MAKQTSSRSSSTPAKRKSTSEAPAKRKQDVAQAAPPAAASADSAPKASVSPPSHEQIAKRAYELYQTRAYAEGNALHDWLRAESDLQAS